MQEPMLSLRPVTNKLPHYDGSYPPGIILAACVCVLVLYACSLYPGSVLRGNGLVLDVFVFIVSLLVFMVVALIFRATAPQTLMVRLFFIPQSAQTRTQSLYIFGALALLTTLYVVVAVRPLPIVPVVAGTILSITAMWPNVRWALLLARNTMLAVWRKLRQSKPLEVVLIDSQRGPFADLE